MVPPRAYSSGAQRDSYSTYVGTRENNILLKRYDHRRRAVLGGGVTLSTSCVAFFFFKSTDINYYTGIRGATAGKYTNQF